MFVGFPSETPDELFETMHFFYENQENIHQIHSGAYVLCENTEIFNDPETFDIEVECIGKNPTIYVAKHKKGTSGEKAEECPTDRIEIEEVHQRDRTPPEGIAR